MTAGSVRKTIRLDLMPDTFQTGANPLRLPPEHPTTNKTTTEPSEKNNGRKNG
jgi:hypothetical protein